MMTWQVRLGDVREQLAALPAQSVQTCITSPPYWGLRDYGTAGQIGLEPTPDVYVATMVQVFREVRRVLRDDGTLWLNLGDSFADKQLQGIPWRVAFALQADGWFLRSDIIWHKPNPMPESVTDRPTKAHEYIFLLTKSARYYYDAAAIAEPVSGSTVCRWGTDRPTRKTAVTDLVVSKAAQSVKGESFLGVSENGRNKRSVFTVPTKPYPEAHFATYPEALIEPCILAGTSERGQCPACGAPWARMVERSAMVIDRSTRTHENGRTRSSGTMVEPPSVVTLGWQPSCACNAGDPIPQTVLDPFTGSGTTGAVAIRHQRSFIGCELNPDYLALARKRIGDVAPLLAREARA